MQLRSRYKELRREIIIESQNEYNRGWGKYIQIIEIERTNLQKFGK